MINTLDPVAQRLNDVFMRIMDAAENSADAVGRETVNWVRSTTSQSQPGVRRGEGARAAHPGGWADRSANLVNAYHHKVQRYPTLIELTFGNYLFEEYGKYLDAPTRCDDFVGARPRRAAGGEYWVLSGILTEPQSPIQSGRFQELLTRALK
jgi:hypothetical protein